jgi:iron complex transport system ATP-binding protein
VTQPSHIIQATGLRFCYRPGKPVLRDVELTGTPERLTCLLGPNGSGKTTLLRCLLAQLSPERGEVLLDGVRVGRYAANDRAKLLAYVPQSPRTAFAFTAGELALMGRFAHTGTLGLAGEADLAVAREAMRMTGTLEFADRTLGELSGGEAQCVMIARALAQQPAVMLLDEPTSHLDIRNQLMIYRMMQRLSHDWKMAVICVSHDVNLAARFADELVLMRDGEIIAAGPPADVIREDLLKQTYDVQIDLIDAPGQDVPLVRAT